MKVVERLPAGDLELSPEILKFLVWVLVQRAGGSAVVQRRELNLATVTNGTILLEDGRDSFTVTTRRDGA